MSTTKKSVPLKITILLFSILFFLPIFGLSEELDFDLPDLPERLDFNMDKAVDLTDALIALQVTSGMDAQVKLSYYAETEDANIGIKEAISILKILAYNTAIQQTCKQVSLITLMDEPQQHDFQESGDMDCVMFYGELDKYYAIKVENTGTRCDAVIELYDTDGKTVLNSVSEGGAGSDKALFWKCEQDGIYFAKVKHADPETFGENTEYELVLDCNVPLSVQDYEEDDEFSQANLIIVEDLCPQRHDFQDENDADWVKFDAEPGFYEIQATQLESRCNVMIELYDSDEKKLDSAEPRGAGEDGGLIWKCEKEGVYYVKVTNDSGIFDQDTGYDLSVTLPTAPWPSGGMIGYVCDASYYTNGICNLFYSYGKVPGITISIRKESTGAVWNAYYINFLGIYYIPWLEKGVYTLAANAPGYEEASVTAEVGTLIIRKDMSMKRQ